MFSMITRAAGLPQAAENHDIRKSEFMVQLVQVMKLKFIGMSYINNQYISFHPFVGVCELV